MQFLEQSTAVTLKIGPFLDSTDGNTEETGLTITQADVRLSKNGANIVQKNEASACTHDELAIYGCPVDATDTDTLGRLQLWVHESGALQVWHEYMVVPSNVWDSLFGSDKLQVDTTQIEGSDATDQIRDAVVDDATRIDASQLNTHSAITAAGIVNEWETQSQADPTGFHVNVLEIEGSDATDQIRDAVVDDATRIDASQLNTHSAITAAGITDDVWDEAIAGHLGAGSTGAALNAAGGAGDPWITALPGAYGAGTAGKIVGDNINAPLSTIDTVVDAIKAVTDNLPDSGALNDLAAILTDTNELQTDWTNGGRLDLIIDAIKAVTDNLPESGALTTITNNVAAILSDTGTDGVIVGVVNVAALADFFNTDSGDTFAGSVAGSVVKEIGDAAGGATADQMWDEEMDANAPADCNTAREYMNVIASAIAGPTADEGDWSAQDLGETKTRIAATLDDEGHRTSIDTLDGT